MPKTSTHVLSNSNMRTNGVQVKNVAEFYGSTLSAAICYCSIHCIPAQKVVSMSAELNHNCSQWVLDSDKGVFFRHSSS